MYSDRSSESAPKGPVSTRCVFVVVFFILFLYIYSAYFITITEFHSTYFTAPGLRYSMQDLQSSLGHKQFLVVVCGI